ncbi:hypothetical protein GALL_335940 [mine drainage metagenome]|uniref:Uncharacterized protein n=1 Tax=mine drainage metagenome TaxID=410659 RepID=A0A1J5R8V6_9ZZZZ
MHQNRDNYETMVDLNMLLRWRKCLQLERARLMGSKVILLRDELPKVICEDEFRRNEFVENAHFRTKHCLSETFLQFNNFGLKLEAHLLSSLRRPT